jgi:hypothetical protein
MPSDVRAGVAMEQENRRSPAAVAHPQRRLGQLDHLQLKALEHASWHLFGCGRRTRVPGLRTREKEWIAAAFTAELVEF